MAVPRLFGVVFLFVSIATAWPVDAPDVSEALTKRLDKPPIPSSSELLAHFNDDLKDDECTYCIVLVRLIVSSELVGVACEPL
jgi:hypothetical protein